MKYASVNYPVDLTEDIAYGQIVGCDEEFRPYEVIDAEILKGDVKTGHFDGDGCSFPDAGHFDWITKVQLQTASPESLRKANEAAADRVSRFPFHLFRAANQ